MALNIIERLTLIAEKLGIIAEKIEESGGGVGDLPQRVSDLEVNVHDLNVNLFDLASYAASIGSIAKRWEGSGEVGNYYYKDGSKSIYKCIVQTMSEPSYDSSDWQMVIVGDELAALNANLSNLFTLFPDGAGTHNSLYRGNFLGTSITSEQSTNISNGTFKDLYVGDYWTIGGVNYRIADFDYFLRTGDTECTQHHAIIVPDSTLYSAQMNTSNTTTGAYVGSSMYKDNLATAKSTIRNSFGNSHILVHREYLKNAVTNGYESNASWYDSDIELMSEEMVYGAPIFSNSVAGTNLATKYTIGCKQLNMFRLRPDLISNRNTYWLRDVVNASCFARVHAYGFCSYFGAVDSFGVRPYFLLH